MSALDPTPMNASSQTSLEDLEAKRQLLTSELRVLGSEIGRRKRRENNRKVRYCVPFAADADVDLRELRRQARMMRDHYFYAAGHMLLVALIESPDQTNRTLGYVDAAHYGPGGDEEAVDGEVGRVEGWHVVLREPRIIPGVRVIGYSGLLRDHEVTTPSNW